jgi:hypothetical protein
VVGIEVVRNAGLLDVSTIFGGERLYLEMTNAQGNFAAII